MNNDELSAVEASITGGPKSEEELLAAARDYQNKITQRNFDKLVAGQNRRKPPGSRSTGLRAATPVPFRRDPNELPDKESTPAPAAAPTPPPRPPLPQVKGTTAKEKVRAIGALFVETARTKGTGTAKEELRDAIMANLGDLCPEYGTFKDLIGLALDIKETSGVATPSSSDFKRRVFSDYLHGKGDPEWATKGDD